MRKTIIWTEDEAVLLVRETRKLCPGYAWSKVADSMNQEMKRRHATTGVAPPRVYRVPGIQSQFARLKSKRPELFEVEDDAEEEDDDAEGDTVVGDSQQAGDESPRAGSPVETFTQEEPMDVDIDERNATLETDVNSQENGAQESDDTLAKEHANNVYEGSQDYLEMTENEHLEAEEGRLIWKYPEPEQTGQEFEEEKEMEEFEDQSNPQRVENVSSNTDLEVIDVESPVSVHPAETTAVPAASTSFPQHLIEAPFPAELKTDVDFACLDYADAVEEYNAYGAASATSGWSQQKFESLREAAALAFERKLEVEREEEQYNGDNFEGWDFK